MQAIFTFRTRSRGLKQELRTRKIVKGVCEKDGMTVVFVNASSTDEIHELARYLDVEKGVTNFNMTTM